MLFIGEVLLQRQGSILLVFQNDSVFVSSQNRVKALERARSDFGGFDEQNDFGCVFSSAAVVDLV